MWIDLNKLQRGITRRSPGKGMLILGMQGIMGDTIVVKSTAEFPVFGS
jgi:hypothetical protein